MDTDKEVNAKCARIKYDLYNDLPLTDELLELALTVVPTAEGSKYVFYNNLADKLKAGEPLDPYEQYILNDVLLEL